MHDDTSPSPSADNTRKSVFDLLRALIGRGFRADEVAHIDGALDDALDPAPDGAPGTGLENRAQSHTSDEEGHTLPPQSDTSAFSAQDRVTCGPSVADARRTEGRCIGEAGIALIKRFEGCARLRRDGLFEAYPDPGTGAEPWTIGWGATGIDDSIAATHGQRIGPETVWTQEQCDARLAADLEHYAAAVDRALGNAPTTQGQFDALVSFHYNTGAIARATLTRKHCAGDHVGALAEFARWNRAGGRALKGLTRRRAAEARLYADSTPDP